MTIRFTCAGCGSLLKIKEELAGTEGKCPKCKTEFVVPDPEDESHPVVTVPKSDSSNSEAKESQQREAKPEKAAKTSSKAKKSSGSDDFDPADFLMGDGDHPGHSRTVDDDGERRRPAATKSEEPQTSRADRSDSRSKKRSATSGAAAAEAEHHSDSVDASSYAKDMMMKAMEQSRAHAGDVPVPEKPPGIDFAGMFREIGLKGIGSILAIAVVFLGMYMFFDSMLSRKLKLPQLGQVSGIVKLDGKPLAGATVYFAPVKEDVLGSDKERARTSYGVTDDAGHYTLTYYESTRGATVGMCRVWLELIGPKGQVIPTSHSVGKSNENTREVKPGKNDFPFDMTTGK